MEGRRRYDRSVTRTGVRTFAPQGHCLSPQKNYYRGHPPFLSCGN